MNVQYDKSMVFGVNYSYSFIASETAAQALRGDANDKFTITAGQHYPRLDFAVTGVGFWKGNYIGGWGIQGCPISVSVRKNTGLFAFLKTPNAVAGFGSKVPPYPVLLNGALGIPVVTDANGRGSAVLTAYGAGELNWQLNIAGGNQPFPLIVKPATLSVPVGSTKTVTTPFGTMSPGPTVPGENSPFGEMSGTAPAAGQPNSPLGNMSTKPGGNPFKD